MRVLLLVIFFVSSATFASAASDPLAEQKKLQKFNVAAPRDPNAEFRKIQDPNAEVRKIQKMNNDHNILVFTDKISKDPNKANFYALRGKAYSGNKEYELALADYNKALQLDPKLADAYVGRAVIHLKNKDYDKSWEDVHKGESLGGKFWPAFKESLVAGSGRDK